MLSDLTSKDSLQNLALIMATAGITQGVMNQMGVGGINASGTSAFTGQSYGDALASRLTSTLLLSSAP